MKKLLIAVLWIAGLSPALAQGEADATFNSGIAQERSRVAREREQVNARFAEQEKLCFRRFAVNDCLSEAKAQRREALSDLRRQEILLNDAERKRKAAEQVRKLEKQAP